MGHYASEMGYETPEERLNSLTRIHKKIVEEGKELGLDLDPNAPFVYNEFLREQAREKAKKNVKG